MTLTLITTCPATRTTGTIEWTCDRPTHHTEPLPGSDTRGPTTRHRWVRRYPLRPTTAQENPS